MRTSIVQGSSLRRWDFCRAWKERWVWSSGGKIGEEGEYTAGKEVAVIWARRQ